MDSQAQSVDNLLFLEQQRTQQRLQSSKYNYCSVIAMPLEGIAV